MAFDSKDSKLTVGISTASVLKVILILIGVGFLWLIRDIAALLFVALILASAFDPTIDWLQRFHFPRSLGVIVIYAIFLSILSSVIIGISGPIATEVRAIAEDLPEYYEAINHNLEQFQATSPFFTPDRVTNIRGGLDEFISDLTQLASKNALPVITKLFGGLFSLMLILVITFYFSVHEPAVKHFIVWLVPKEKESQTIDVIDKIQKKLGLWLRGQVLLSLIIFVIIYVGLKIIGIRYALVLALLAGFFEMVPYLGPVLSAVPAIFLTLISPWGGLFKAFLVLLLYFFVQQAENNLIVPKVMSKTVGLNPLVVIIAILVGAKIGGVVGALMGVPVATALTVYLEALGYKRELVV